MTVYCDLAFSSLPVVPDTTRDQHDYCAVCTLTGDGNSRSGKRFSRSGAGEIGWWKTSAAIGCWPAGEAAINCPLQTMRTLPPVCVSDSVVSAVGADLRTSRPRRDGVRSEACQYQIVVRDTVCVKAVKTEAKIRQAMDGVFRRSIQGTVVWIRPV